MPFTAHPGGFYNIAGTFNDFLRQQLTARGLPDWMTSAVINYDYPREPLTYPSFSITHIGGLAPTTIAEGYNLDPGWRGVRQNGLAEVSCWESVERSKPYQNRNIQQMRDMVARIYTTGAATQILDVYGSTANPTGNGTLLRMMPVEMPPQATDPNPDIVRIRLLVSYNWLERATGG